MKWLWCWGAVAGCSLVFQQAACGETIRFVGDVMLGRLVGAKISMDGRSPWDNWVEPSATAMVGNFEGAVGSASECLAKPICLSVEERHIETLPAAGFTHMVLANNHAADLGERGLARTAQALEERGVAAIDQSRSPAFIRLGGHSVAVVVGNTIPDALNRFDRLPGYEIARQMRLAAALADWTVTYLHWGAEMRNWQADSDERTTSWLIQAGADLVIGAHPHVTIEPRCQAGRPVFPSLGNHVFDQRYPATWTGMVADCSTGDGRLSCKSWTTVREAGSYAPKRAAPDRALSCSVAARARQHFGGVAVTALRRKDGRLSIEAWSGPKKLWVAPPAQILSFDRARFERANDRMVLMLLRGYSEIDRETAPRPYVYEVRENGLHPRWRGSALAWPLLDARPMRRGDGTDVLCALHRGDSFMLPNKRTRQRLAMVYRWNGFGFSGERDKDLTTRCLMLWEALGESVRPGA